MEDKNVEITWLWDRMRYIHFFLFDFGCSGGGLKPELLMTKLAIIPCTVLLETLFFRKQFRFFVGYGFEISKIIPLIVFCYCVIAPIIISFGVVYFGVGWLVFRESGAKSLCSLVRKLWTYVASHTYPGSESYGQRLKLLDSEAILIICLNM
ncbi:hypothetical protein POM88_046115 [Heracleum sosnowskyi]|uniref:Uncharacterized protein n=1 Tax=Heracleum sosnowskyi TaxID=360622 RepID=A0AAD8H782_9APIA|nr:hypothetical protein POM88_046115 [Heracleum sosnowskyi]